MHHLFRPCILSFVFSFICGLPLYSQSSNSFTYQFSYTSDLLYNTSGGIKQKTAYLGLANFMIGFDTQAAHAWQGGTFFINLANTHGNEPSKNLIGDFQGLTNIEAGNHTMLYEFWYRQTASTYSFTIGLQDMNMTFMSNDIACSFINSSFAIHPTLSKNIPAPIYPLTALGMMFNWSVTPSVDCKIALYDGTPESFIQNPYNLKWNFNKRNGWLFISEFDKKGSLLQDMAGSYKIGFYFHQSENIQLMKQTDYGIYSIINQQLIKTRTCTISFFSQIGIAPKTTNKNPYFLSLGITSKGFLHNRPNDEIGIGCAHAILRYTNVKNETALETYYAVQLNKIFYIKPDIQYIIHPSGEDQYLANALVGILRFGIHL
jgi:porin